MTDGDRKFLARLVASHRAVISEYFRRVARADKKAQEIEQSCMRPRKF